VAEEDQGAALRHRREAAFGQLVPLGGCDRLPDDRQDVLLSVVVIKAPSVSLRLQVSGCRGRTGPSFAGRRLAGRHLP